MSIKVAAFTVSEKSSYTCNGCTDSSPIAVEEPSKTRVLDDMIASASMYIKSELKRAKFVKKKKKKKKKER